MVLGLVTGGMDMNLYIQAEDTLLNRFCIPIRVTSRPLRLIISKPWTVPIITAVLSPTIQIPLALLPFQFHTIDKSEHNICKYILSNQPLTAQCTRKLSIQFQFFSYSVMAVRVLPLKEILHWKQHGFYLALHIISKTVMGLSSFCEKQQLNLWTQEMNRGPWYQRSAA